MLFALDTDIFSHLLLKHARVVARYTQVVNAGVDEIAIPSVVRAEVLIGRFDALRKASSGADALSMQDRLRRTEGALAPFRVLPIDRAAADHFDRLLPDKRLNKMGRADLLIACIALANGATLVTRNTRDYASVPGLALDDWAA